jgi:hypothetical protein
MSSSFTDSLRQLRSKFTALLHDNSLYNYQHDETNTYQPNTDSLAFRIADSLSRTWDLGFTAFGGPPVHFQILYRRFVQPRDGRVAWVDDQTVGHKRQEEKLVCPARSMTC